MASLPSTPRSMAAGPVHGKARPADSDKFSAMPLNNKMAYIADDLALRLSHIQQQLHGKGRFQDSSYLGEVTQPRSLDSMTSPPENVQYPGLEQSAAGIPAQLRHDGSPHGNTLCPEDLYQYNPRGPPTLNQQTMARDSMPLDSIENTGNVSKAVQVRTAMCPTSLKRKHACLTHDFVAGCRIVSGC
jgi:hypothetical protein